MQVTVLDSVLHDIETKIAAYPPERGGALLGPVGMPIVTELLFDDAGSVTAASYNASDALRANVRHRELTDGSVEFKGIIHSHPGGLDHPSGQDRRAFTDSLVRREPHLGRFHGPIVTRQRATAPHEVPVTSGKVSWFFAERRGDQTEVVPAGVRVLPVRRLLRRLAQSVHGTVDGELMNIIDDRYGVLIGGTVRVDGEAVEVFISPSYPAVPPIAMIDDGEICRQIAIPWTLDDIEENIARLAREISGSLDRADDSTSAPDDGTASMDQQAGPLPELRGWIRRRLVPAGIQARLGPVLGGPIDDCSVLIVGCGSVGSTAAESLARSGVGQFVLVDPDRVAYENLSRAAYGYRDVRRKKVKALARRLRRINPRIKVKRYASDLHGLGEERLLEVLGDTDVVLCSADDPDAVLELNHFAYARGIPAIYVGIYRRAHGGEVVAALPGVTRCYRCAVPTRGRSEVEPAFNYGTGRLNAEPALGTDILHITTAGVKAAIAVLASKANPESPQTQWLLDALDDPEAPRSYLVMSTVADYWFLPEVFDDTAAQGPYQAIWMNPAGDPTCPVCGTDPIEPSLAAIPSGAEIVSAARLMGLNDGGEEASGEAA